jgi:hypothetical protein
MFMYGYSRLQTFQFCYLTTDDTVEIMLLVQYKRLAVKLIKHIISIIKYVKISFGAITLITYMNRMNIVTCRSDSRPLTTGFRLIIKLY